jgi:hypothetical protein
MSEKIFTAVFQKLLLLRGFDASPGEMSFQASMVNATTASTYPEETIDAWESSSARP